METTYNYVIIGGGTAGLVLANRLSEDRAITVAVLEAGVDTTADPRTVVPALFNSALTGELDWNLATVPQSRLDGRRIGHHQGKALGGSSAINLQALVPFSANDVDAWESLVGNEGWNYASLSGYRDKAISVDLPDAKTSSALNLSWASQWAAETAGPVQSSWVDVPENPILQAWNSAFESLGYPLTASPFSGKSTGSFTAPSTVEATSKTRSYAASAYYLPAADRENLHVITKALVSKINLEDRGGNQTATGVTYTREGSTETILANKEIILSAGAFDSPKVLELSGIGDPEVLKAAGVDTIVENKYVGSNLQDHIQVPMSFEVVDGFPTGDDILRGDPEAIAVAQAQYAETQSGPFANPGVTNFAYLPTVDFENNATEKSRALAELRTAELVHPLDAARKQLLEDLLERGDEGTGQYFLFTAQSYKAGRDTTHGLVPEPQAGSFITPCVGLSHPLSTGTVHISSSDVNIPPTIDHNYLSHPLDLELHSRHARYLETIAEAPPLVAFLKPNGARNDPLAFVGGSLVKAKRYAKAASGSNWHSVGTVAMAPREKGGVVDSSLRVYGVSNLRVVDASVFPLVPQSNTQSLVYAVAERAADLIKKG
ncbi:unnamed protein product [Periconia digitata]|uniref:Glucose-methanol-choline oxidoreductase N-terminal domain-containing protein n=1 Tax=Periconia digitata TaxID=1303443 RepID=A0A9W4US73_9PLEO|nr:unnamed protein product [Periconia digitata]